LIFDAIDYGQDGILRYLIEERGADLTVIDRHKENILFKALDHAEELPINVMKYVLDEKKAKIDINWRNEDGKTVLWSAVAHWLLPNRTDIVQYLVREKHADVNIPDEKYQQTSLHKAISSSHYCEELFKCLVDHGANVAQKDVVGDTPLHLAARSNSPVEVCKYLIEHGADVNQRNNKGETPLDIAISNDNHEVCKCLDVGWRNENGETLVHVAAIRNKISLLEYLVREKHADVNAPRTNDHWTPLHCAAFWNNYESCEFLIKHGANPIAEGTCGKTPAQVASDERLISFIRNASTTTRMRRSVGPHQFSAPLQDSILYHEYTRLGIVGNLRENSWISLDDARLRLFQFQNFLFFTRWLLRYLSQGSCSARSSQGEPQIVSPGAAISDPVAEAAVGTFPRFEDSHFGEFSV
jgi:ankyrin repeat protein